MRSESVVLDVGATIGADATQLVEFAVMGEAMARCLFGLEKPTVGLLNIGVEEIKGVEQVKEAGRILRDSKLPLVYAGLRRRRRHRQGHGRCGRHRRLHRQHRAEGRRRHRQAAGDLSEAVPDRAPGSRSSERFLASGAFKALRDRMDPRKHNGGVFLGLNGVVVKSHGGTDALGFATAIDVALDMVRNDLVSKIKTDVEVMNALHQAGGAARQATGTNDMNQPPMAVRRSVIAGCGSALPQRVMTNADMSKVVDTSDEWIVERTGIHARHIANDSETTRTLGVEAARRALDHAGLTADAVDLIILATSTPDQTFPATATLVQADLGITRGAAFDVQAVCSGFVYALSVADAMIKSGQAECVLVIGSETFSRILDWTDRTTCVLFGDGAGAMVLKAETLPDSQDEPRHPRHPHPLRRALSRQALCRWRAVDHQDGRAPAHGRPRGLQACRGQHRVGHGRSDEGGQRVAAATSTGSCRTRRTAAFSKERPASWASARTAS